MYISFKLDKLTGANKNLSSTPYNEGKYINLGSQPKD